ncbi:O-methyltransferase, family 2 [Penicillium occitanis (nom. inval.)]|nr:O-methyltransferase, family 2 [Penicillium occitanis (nom. inval.)]PCG95017.1 hypothetical protein PENOC_079950 [Penicillium occitanis (nom. inval.)]
MTVANGTHARRIVDLANLIQDSVAKLDQVFIDQNTPLPSFEEDAPASLPDEALELQRTVLDATDELHDLLLDPLSLIYKNTTCYNLISLQVISRFNIACMVPPGGTISYDEIARQTDLNEPTVRRLLRHAMALHIFQEPEQGMVAHTNASRLLRDPGTSAFMSFHPEIAWPSTVKLLEAWQKWPGSEEPSETAFSLAHNGIASLYELFSRNPEGALRFAAGMQVFGNLPQFHMDRTVEGYEWQALGKSKIVDVGGSEGHLCIALAQRYPDLTFVVQDMAKVVEKGQANLPHDLEGRVEFVAHDAFFAQNIDADVYLFRTVFHNWSDKYCIRILRALVPVLKPGVKILINDMCLPRPGTIPARVELDMRCMDLSMAALFNARERDEAEWRNLLLEADSRFVLKRVIQPPGAALAIMEVVWEETSLFP